MKMLFILNEAPYGSERCYNALRLAGSLAQKPDVEVRAFLMGDAAPSGKKGQKVPAGYYNVESMLHKVVRSDSGNVSVCGTCMDARGIAESELADGTHKGTLNELSEWTLWADRVLVF